MRGHPVYRTIGIKKTGTFRGMRLPGSVPVFFRFLEKGEETGPFRLLFCNGHRSDVRVYALIPVKEALGVDGLADLQGLYLSLIHI